MPSAEKLKSFTESAVKELQFAETPPAVIRRTLRLIESVIARAERPLLAPANDDRPVTPQWGRRGLNANEIAALTALIAFHADEAGLTPSLVTQAVECTFDVDQLADLQAWQFDETVRYLVGFARLP
jgi:hypothetical protein